MKRTLLTVAGALVALVLIVVIVGSRLPQGHVASRERVLAVEPDRVFALISTPEDFPAWRTGVQRVEMLPLVEGKTLFREVGSDGAISYVFDEVVPDQRLVSRIADEGLPFGGQWTFELSPVPEGTALRITEDGQVYNPVFRFVSRFVIGHHATIDRYLADLEARVGG
jgi:uncharacterized protein YndB with AHSA1/START domain